MDIEQLRKDAADGKLHVEPLIEIIASLLEINQQLREEIQELRDNSSDHRRNNKLDEPYSEKAEKKRKAKRRRRPKPLRRGRMSTADKIKLAERTEQVFPQLVDPADCKLSHTRFDFRCEGSRSSSRYCRAVFLSISAILAAVASDLPVLSSRRSSLTCPSVTIASSMKTGSCDHSN